VSALAPVGTWCVTGGAGYIGAHVVAALQACGTPVVVLDDLSTGSPSRIPAGVPLIHASVLDTAAVAAALTAHGVTGVIHLAAKKAVGESVSLPLHYYAENVSGMIELLQAMAGAGVRRIVYSSSAAVYGSATAAAAAGLITPGAPIGEEVPASPESPYGQTKLIGEWLLAAAGSPEAARAAGVPPLAWVALRYFNVAGAGRPDLGDTSVNNLIPLTFRNLDLGRRPQLFGVDYPTPDGSCIRDYIHVADLAAAHVLAAAGLETGAVTGEVLNVGTGRGSSVIEVFRVIAATVGGTDDYDVVARRAGDPPALVAAVERIRTRLGWRAEQDLTAMVHSAWEAWQAAREARR